MNFKACLVLATVLLSVTATAGVYKWTDSGGRVHYSDKPPKTAEKLDIETQRTDPAQLAARLDEETTQTQQRETIIADQSEQEELERAQQARREENCKRARKAMDSLLSATRVYEPLPDGDRRYLEQDEVDARKTAAQRDVDEWCGDKP